MATKTKDTTKEIKEKKLCLTGSGAQCRGDFAGLGMDARYKSRLLKLARGQKVADLPTKAQLAKLGYDNGRLALIPQQGMTSEQAVKILEARGWGRFLKAKGDTKTANGKAPAAKTTKRTTKGKGPVLKRKAKRTTKTK